MDNPQATSQTVQLLSRFRPLLSSNRITSLDDTTYVPETSCRTLSETAMKSTTRLKLT
jgi:hypothetical protein